MGNFSHAKVGLSAAFALFLGACGGGSFGTGDVISVGSMPRPSKTISQDDKVDTEGSGGQAQALPEHLQASVGFGVRLPLRNTAKTADGKDVEPVRNIRPSDMQINGGGAAEGADEAEIRRLAAENNIGFFSKPLHHTV